MDRQGLLQDILWLWYIVEGAATAHKTTFICLLVLSGLYMLFCTLAVGWLSFLYLAITVHLGLDTARGAVIVKVVFILSAVSLSIAQKVVRYLGYRRTSQTISAVNVFISYSIFLWAGIRVSRLLKRWVVRRGQNH